MRLTMLWISIIILLSHGAFADVRGTQNAELSYFITPLQNDPLTVYVHQGDTLIQGKTYDLSGVTGLTYQFSHWNNWKDDNSNCNPQNINDIWYIRTGISPKAVTLDSEHWPVGNWNYWDPVECNITHFDRSSGKTVSATAPLEADNKFVFKIIRPPQVAYPRSLSMDFSAVPVQKYSQAYIEQNTTRAARG